MEGISQYGCSDGRILVHFERMLNGLAKVFISKLEVRAGCAGTDGSSFNKTPIGSGRLSLEGQTQRDANGAAVINSLLIEAVEEPPEIRIAVERVERNLPCSRVHREVEGSK